MTGLDSFQRSVLAAFFERQPGFFLTGGAALVGFYLSHRTTQDLDLFTTDDLVDDGDRALEMIARELGASVDRLRTSPTFRRRLLTRGAESVLVDLVRDLAPQIEEVKPVFSGIRVDSPREIMANKLCSLLSRAELRDLVDVRALEHAGYPMEEHLSLAMRKDAGLTAGQLAWVLSQVEIGEDARLPGEVTIDELRGYLADLVRRLTALAYPEGS